MTWPHRRADEGEAALLGLALELAQHLFLPFPELLLDVLPPPAVVFALKGRRDRGAQLLDETLHVTAEPACTAGWEPQSVWFVGFGEVVDIAPIWRGRLFGGLAFKIPTHHRIFTRSLRPQSEEIIAVMGDADPETYRLNGPSLANDTGQLFQVGCGLKGKLHGVTALTERCGLQRLPKPHSVMSPSCMRSLRRRHGGVDPRRVDEW
jgi:hypothetical protein